MFTKQSNTLRFSQEKSEKGKFSSSGSFQDSLTSSILALTTTDNCTANVTVSNDVALPISKQGTLRVTSAYSNDHSIATSQRKEIVIKGVVEPVPSATNTLRKINDTTCPQAGSNRNTFQNQTVNATVLIQFFKVLGIKAQFIFDTTSGIIDANQLFSGRNGIRIKNNHGWEQKFNLNRPGA